MKRSVQINRTLNKLGFGQLTDPNLSAQMAMCVRDHEHYRQLLAVCEPEKRYIMYTAMTPHLRFKAKPLEDYIIEMKQLAEREKRPIFDEKTGKLTDFDDYHLGQSAERAIAIASRGSLTVKCIICTTARIFGGLNKYFAAKAARDAGWKRRGNKAVCPTCALATN